MTSLWQLEVKMNLSEVNMKPGLLVVFIRHDFAEIWGFRYGLKLALAI
jgi:hypothetical protein